jgi:hypothetical protein
VKARVLGGEVVARSRDPAGDGAGAWDLGGCGDGGVLADREGVPGEGGVAAAVSTLAQLLMELGGVGVADSELSLEEGLVAIERGVGAVEPHQSDNVEEAQ